MLDDSGFELLQRVAVPARRWHLRATVQPTTETLEIL